MSNEAIRRAILEHCDSLGKADPKNTSEIAAHLGAMILNYYDDVLRQAQRSFITAVIAGLVGTVLIFAGVIAAWFRHDTGWSPSIVSALGGTVMLAVTGVLFKLYELASRQFAAFHICLERMNRFVLANTICNNVNNETERDNVRSELVQIIARAPMLTIDRRAPAQKESREFSPAVANVMQAV